MDQEEEFQSTPWDALLDQGRSWRWWAGLAAAAVVVGAVAASVTSRVWPVSASPAPTSPPTSTLPQVAELPAVPTVALPAEPHTEAVEVGSVAAWYAADYFTSTEPPTYVERAVPVSVERLGPELHAVVVLVQVLARDEPGYRRLEPKAVEVVVDTSDGIRVVDRPQPAEARISFDTVELAPAEVPQGVVDRAVELATAAGSPLAETSKGAKFEGGWRIEIEVVDEAGIAWPMVVWLDHGGDQIHPPG